MTKLIHVAAAAIFDQDGRLLLALRDKKQHQGGLWEFPGGKVEPGEDVRVALARELHEELGIDIDQSATSPLIQVPYHYPDKSVLLDVFRVNCFTGEAWGREGQPLEWIEISQLPQYEFPAANKPIVNALLLPQSIAITPELEPAQYLEYIKRLSSRVDAVMLRAKHLTIEQQQAVLPGLKSALKRKGVALFWNSSVESANQWLENSAQAQVVDGLHLSSIELSKLRNRDQFRGLWLGASCHSSEEIRQAVEKGLDYITLSPVQKTKSHPETEPLGWDRFAGLVADCPIPVYGLGGISPADRDRIYLSGGQGVAGISGFVI